MSWADARRPVPRLWIRSAEGVGVGETTLGEWEHNILCVFIFQIILIFDVFFFFQN